jgi:hypothetical protein
MSAAPIAIHPLPVVRRSLLRIFRSIWSGTSLMAFFACCYELEHGRQLARHATLI